MKILVLTNKMPYPPRDGGSIATLNMITSLRDAGHQITCLSLNTSKHPFPPGQIPLPLRASIRFLAVEANTDIRPLALAGNLIFSGKPYIATRFRVKAYSRLLEQLLKEESFDVIQMEGPYLGFYLPVIRSRCRTPVSLRAHNVEFLIWERKARQEARTLRRWYLQHMARRLKRFEAEVVEQSDLLVPISPVDEEFFLNQTSRILGYQKQEHRKQDYLKQGLQKQGLQKQGQPRQGQPSQGLQKQGHTKPILTLPAGLRIKEYPLTSLPPEPTLFFIGALDWLPNQEGLEWFLKEVFPGLVSRVPSMTFHVAGRNAPGHVTRRLAHPNITFHGEVEDAIRFMQEYRIMVAPLKTGSGIRIKILEGMAMGRPVITTPAGIEGINAEHGREVLVSGDPEWWTEHLSSLLSGDEEAIGLAAAARKFVIQNFDTFEIANRLGQFYKSQA